MLERVVTMILFPLPPESKTKPFLSISLPNIIQHKYLSDSTTPLILRSNSSNSIASSFVRAIDLPIPTVLPGSVSGPSHHSTLFEPMLYLLSPLTVMTEGSCCVSKSNSIPNAAFTSSSLPIISSAFTVKSPVSPLAKAVASNLL
ncbi:hypothetical protein SADUNF_Sadunf04G0093900 [Salix dunnii]|uniref:Uncharacterized protein n=1 Tax=Salix dunnii TaxID=1413687 RepID=A0A835KBA6_9ROSI|nr:hypothetical protein SADUNF_Sadunf04G0093900 [Salix dunnii]